MIEARVLKGFRDFLPSSEIARQNIISKLQTVFTSFGFLPIDTPVLEYSDVLLGKGSGETDKQLYRFNDNGGRDVALRFDLTVPFARYMAIYHSQLPLPFKRYHIAKVWRGENSQKGRYREFMQCDFDIVGVDSVEADYEVLSLMNSSFAALGISNINFHISHRGLFNDFLQSENISASLTDILRTVDKLAKIGIEKVREELSAWCSSDQIEKILQFISIKAPLSEGLAQLSSLISPECEGFNRLTAIEQIAKSVGNASLFVLDLSITRGLDYYTGIVYETFITNLSSIGSVCSGGRYNDLASLYTNQKLPGVGASIGLDRLIAALEDLQVLENKNGLTDIIVFNIDERFKSTYIGLTFALREAGLNAEYFLSTKKFDAQFKYAEKKEIPFALILGEEEISKNSFTLKNLLTRKTHNFNSISEVANFVKENLKK